MFVAERVLRSAFPVGTLTSYSFQHLRLSIGKLRCANAETDGLSNVSCPDIISGASTRSLCRSFVGSVAASHFFPCEELCYGGVYLLSPH